MNAERLEVVKLLSSSVMPLGILTLVVLGVILFGITTATESGRGWRCRSLPACVSGPDAELETHQGAVFLTAKTTAMVCWLFVGSALFSAVFAHPRRAGADREWVLSLDLTPVQFMILSQADHLHSRLAAGMDRDHHHLRADLFAAAEALRHRPAVLRGLLSS